MASGLLEGGAESFDQYAAAFQNKAAEAKYSETQIKAALTYAANIDSKSLPIIYDAHHLAQLSLFKVNFIYGVSNDAAKFYRKFYIKKRSGGSRPISEPLPDLKELQKWILENLVSRLPVSKFCHAFRSGRSIKTNARLHIRREVLVKSDIENFFSSIKIDSVFGLIRKQGYTEAVSTMISRLCTLDGVLPQGAPTSAALSNAILYEFDEALGSWSLENGWRYSRYADDLAFSGQGDVDDIFKHIHDICNGFNFTVNKTKNRVLRTGSRQVICGVVVNEKISVPRPYIRKLRQEIYYIQKFGLDAHIARIGAKRARYVDVLRGRLAHARWVCEHDQDKVAQLDRLTNALKVAVGKPSARKE